ncbi:MAG: S8 family serine peptidase, partial [Bacteroidota bacterium]
MNHWNLRVLTLLVLLWTGIALAADPAAAFDRSRIDVRLMKEIERTQRADAQKGTYRLLKQNGKTWSADVIIRYTDISGILKLGIQPQAVYKTLLTARVTAEQILQLSNTRGVSFIEGSKMSEVKLDKSRVEMKVDKVHSGVATGSALKGKGIIVGVIDSGIDWKHQDFRKDSDTTKTRILFLWDQTDERTGVGPATFNYGAEYTSAQINDELDGTPAGKVLEDDSNGHGTHVAGIAAGDGSTSAGLYTGVAPEADLIIVKGGNGGFTSTNVINGIAYIRQKSEALGKPFVINMSLGGHGGAHDGTDAQEVVVDEELNGKTGRQIVMAAGNEGSDQIHANDIQLMGDQKTITVTVPAYTPQAGAENDIVYISMWHQFGDAFTISVKMPNNTVVTAKPWKKVSASNAAGYCEVANSQGAVNSKGAIESTISIGDSAENQPPMTGDWVITVKIDTYKVNGVFDMWIAGATIPEAQFTSGHSMSKLVGIPATAELGITVGSYVTKWQWTATDGNTYSYNGTSRLNDFSTFSSMGPTRDGRQKPDVCAPGQAIAAPRSSLKVTPAHELIGAGGKYVIEQGTSMATPQVAGLIALMLQYQPTLTAEKIRSTLNTTSRKDSFTGASASDQWGSGKVDAVAALKGTTSVR